MANFNLGKRKNFVEDNMRYIIQILTGLMASQSTISSQCLKDYNPDETYTKGQICLYNNYVWLCKTVTTGAFEENKWEKQSDGFTELSIDDVKAMLRLTPNQIDYLAKLISDSSIVLDHTWSSSKSYTEIQNAIKTAKEFCVIELAKKSTGSFKKANDVSEITDENYFYLIYNNGTSKYDIYALLNNNVEKLTTVDVNLDDYLTKTDAENTYLKKTDADGKYATITTVDGKVNKTDILTANSPSATDDQVYSAKAINTELDKKVNKTDVEEANIVNLMPFPYDSSIISVNSGITFKVDDEGAIHVSGTKTTDNLVQYYPIRDTIGTSGYLIDTFEVGKTYTLSGCPSGGSTKTYRLRILFNYDKSSEGLTPYQYIDMGAGVTFTIESEIKYIRIMIDYSGTTNTTYGDLIFKPQITEGAKVIDFKTSLNRNNLSQLNNTVTSTINGLNGRIPINSGEDMDNITTVGFYSVLSGSIALTVSNLPIKSACFVDVYGNNHTVGKGWLVQEIKASNSADAPIYRRSRIHEGDWGQWQRLCVTKVADKTFDVSSLTSLSSNYTFLAIKGVVKNGFCTCTIGIKVVNPVLTNEDVASGMPNAQVSYYVPPMLNWSDVSGLDTTSPLHITISTDGLIRCEGGVASKEYYATVTYPVAES